MKRQRYGRLDREVALMSQRYIGAIMIYEGRVVAFCRED